MRRLLGTLVVLIAIVLGVGIWRGWFDFRSPSNSGGEKGTSYSVDVDRTQIERDTAAVERAARQTGERIKENVQGVAAKHTANGIINEVGRTEKNLRVRTYDNKDLTVSIEPSTKIMENEQNMQLDGLQKGEQVWISYSVQDGKNVARSITLLPSS